LIVVRIRVPVQHKQLIMSKIGNYIQESYDELVHKVSWPTWDELQQTTIIVLVALIIITLVILGMDTASEWVLKAIYGLLGK
jgi:preprotein translocase subunit SecE